MEGDLASGGSAPTLVGCAVEVLDELDEVWRRARVLETVGKQHRLLFEGQTVAETLPLLPGMYRVYDSSSSSAVDAPKDADAPSMQEDTSDAAFAKSHAEPEAKETKKNAAYHEQSAAAANVASTQVCAQQQPCHMLPAGGGTWSPPNGQAMRDVTPRTKLAATSLLQGALGYRVLAGSVVGQPARVADDPRELKKPKVEGFSSQAKYAAGLVLKRKAAIGTPSFVVVVVVVVVVVLVVVVVVVVPNICVVQQLPALPALLTGRLPRPRSR